MSNWLSPELQKADKVAKACISEVEQLGILAVVFLLEPQEETHVMAAWGSDTFKGNGPLGERMTLAMLMTIIGNLFDTLGEDRARFFLAAMFEMVKESKLGGTRGSS